MEMNFPHDQPLEVSSTPVSLRKLDMDILRVLAFAPVTVDAVRPAAAVDAPDRDTCLMALFAGSGRADRVARGSFNPHAAHALARLGPAGLQDEIGVYHYASGNRKATRLLRSSTEIYTSQAF